MHIGVLYNRVRVEEKLLIEDLARRGVSFELLDTDSIVFDLQDRQPWTRFNAILERSISHSRAEACLRMFDMYGIPCVNPVSIADVCGSKLNTSLALVKHGVPTTRIKLALTEASALQAIEEMGYPVVLKPAVGSWGRLIARVNDRESAEALLEHKATLGSYHHSVFYIQEYIRKPGRDLRTFVVGDETICGIARNSEHWITNTARGGKTSNLPITPELHELSQRTARAVGGGIVAIDILECPDRGFLVNEVNYTMEFKNSIEPTGVNIPAKINDYLIGIAAGKIPEPGRSPIPPVTPTPSVHTAPARPATGAVKR